MFLDSSRRLQPDQKLSPPSDLHTQLLPHRNIALSCLKHPTLPPGKSRHGKCLFWLFFPQHLPRGAAPPGQPCSQSDPGVWLRSGPPFSLRPGEVRPSPSGRSYHRGEIIKGTVERVRERDLGTLQCGLGRKSSARMKRLLMSVCSKVPLITCPLGGVELLPRSSRQ